MRVPGSSGLRLLFGTPLFSTPLSGVDDLNDALATLILGMREAEPSGAAAKMRSVDGFDSASAWRTGDDFLQRREVCPTEGLLVLFPSWLSHSVTRLADDGAAGERIAVAFNVHGAEV